MKDVNDLRRAQKESVVPIKSGRGIDLHKVALDLGEWALSILEDLKGYTVHILRTEDTEGYDVGLMTSNTDFFPVASLAWLADGNGLLAKVTFTDNEYGRALSEHEYSPFTRR